MNLEVHICISQESVGKYRLDFHSKDDLSHNLENRGITSTILMTITIVVPCHVRNPHRNNVASS